jgi:nucleoside diphosphate kinase
VCACCSSQVLAYAEAVGCTLVASSLLTLTDEQVKSLHGGVMPPAEITTNLTRGPSLALAISRPLATHAWTALMGPADPAVAAAEAPLSLRALYGTDSTRNTCFGSASEADASRDISNFFPSLLSSHSTLAVLTPDATPHIDAILDAVASIGLSITSRLDATLSADRAAEYLKLLGPGCPPPATLTGAPPPPGSFEAVVAHLSSAPSVVLVLSGKGAVEQWAALLGPLDPRIAKVRCPACLRARFGMDMTHAVGYGSLSLAAAASELKFFFPRAVVQPLSKADSRAYVESNLSPTISDGLVALARAKPDKPIEWLAKWMLANNPFTPSDGATPKTPS